MLASLRLQVHDAVDAGQLVARLTRTVNSPGWPFVDVYVSGDRLSFAAETWEPVLRVRIEDALEHVLGVRWREHAQWV
jgi:hypothetical protein